MKNKIVSLIAALVLAFTLVGCSGSGSTGCGTTESAPKFDAALPWAQSNNETCTYSISKSYIPSKGDKVEVASGTYVTALSTLGDETTVRNSFDITYNDNEHTKVLAETGSYVINANLSDSYSGGTTFNKDTLVPIKGDKTFTLAQRPLCDDENGFPAAMSSRIDNPEDGVIYRYVLPGSVKYGDPRGYSYTADYNSNATTFSTTKGTTKTIKEGDATVYNRDYAAVEKSNLKLKNGVRYDNEQLNYVVRALQNIKAKGSATIYLTNIYDSYLNNSYVRYTMTVSCADKTKKATLSLDASKYVISDAEVEFEPDEDGKITVPCVEVTVAISSSTAGPGIKFLITDPSVTITERDSTKKMKKLVVKMTYSEYSPKDVNLAYETVYTLTDYSTKI